MDPIPPATFYGNLMSTPDSDAMIDPVLLGNTTNASRPPSTAMSAPPVAPPLRSTLESTDSMAWKVREEFSLKDLEQLLRAVIDINPYMAPRNKIGEQWKQVARLVQDQGHCLNRDVDTLKNKLGSMLAWVEGGEKDFSSLSTGKGAGT
ncbi:hypothetical protein JB92DRAFT_3094086 [Gautieria morchelliformis]|nr:hypothetical protein JB92DRAFT_3094086 [Gautieria morchelliformis]